MNPLLQIGWLVAAEIRDPLHAAAAQEAPRRLHALLAAQFPQFSWEVIPLRRQRYGSRGAIDPLTLLELGGQAKLQHGWDYTLVVVPNELTSRHGPYAVGIPSSALETAVLSMAHLELNDRVTDQLVGLALHELGHLWGVEHRDIGPMRGPVVADLLREAIYPPDQERAIANRLERVTDRRLEEQSRQWGRLTFYWRTLLANPRSIIVDVWGYAPWRLPVRMGRLTAATAVSIGLLLLTAEAWEVGTSIRLGMLGIATVLALLFATLAMFVGQDLGAISRTIRLREQVARTRIVLFGTLFSGLVTLWLVLFSATLILALVFPPEVLSSWTGIDDVGRRALVRQAAFMAMLGVLAGALGGNLEQEQEFKADLLYDEET
jgi:hypothetical protein